MCLLRNLFCVWLLGVTESVPSVIKEPGLCGAVFAVLFCPTPKSPIRPRPVVGAVCSTLCAASCSAATRINWEGAEHEPLGEASERVLKGISSRGTRPGAELLLKGPRAPRAGSVLGLSSPGWERWSTWRLWGVCRGLRRKEQIPSTGVCEVAVQLPAVPREELNLLWAEQSKWKGFWYYVESRMNEFLQISSGKREEANTTRVNGEREAEARKSCFQQLWWSSVPMNDGRVWLSELTEGRLEGYRITPISEKAKIPHNHHWWPLFQSLHLRGKYQQ